MKQRKLESLIEAVLNTVSGLLVSACVWVVVGPWFGYTVLFATALSLSAVFTVTSTIRSYLWRRFFENWGNEWMRRILYKSKDAEEEEDAHLHI